MSGALNILGVLWEDGLADVARQVGTGSEGLTGRACTMQFSGANCMWSHLQQAAAGTAEVGDGPRGSSLPAYDGACPRGARTTEIVQSWLEMPPEAERAGNKYPGFFLPPAFLIG